MRLNWSFLLHPESMKMESGGYSTAGSCARLDGGKRLLPCRALWPGFRGEHSGVFQKTSIPVLAFACEHLLCVLLLAESLTS